MGHPIFSSIRYLVIYLLFWGLIILSSALINYYYYHLELGVSFIDSLTYNLSFSVIAIGLWYTIRYSSIEKFNWFKRLLHHTVEGIIISILWMLAVYFLLSSFFPDNERYHSLSLQSIPINFLIGLIFYTLFMLFYYLVISYRNLQEKTKNEAELKTLVKEAELNLLKSQINPHFLFNSLNSISSLTVTNPHKAREMIIKLSEFLRHSIGHKERMLVPLKEEIEHILLYLDIEKVRFGDRLDYHFDISQKCEAFPIPLMIFQPLFENAIKHGVYESTDLILVNFSCTPVTQGIWVKISNNYDKDAPPRKGNRMGIKNVENRLKLIYQSDDLLKINKTDHNFEVEIVIPRLKE